MKLLNSNIILWVVGPALGHISRCFSIATILKEKYATDSVFVCSDRKGFLNKIVAPHFKTLCLETQRTEYLQFALEIENLISNLRPCVVCYDLTPIPWLVAHSFPKLPTVYITNFFLTDISNTTTVQIKKWEQQKDKINKQRKEKSLATLAHIKDSYNQTLTILCDPPELLGKLPIPKRCSVVGSCAWEPNINIPKELENKEDILLISWGSTGGKLPGMPWLKKVAARAGCSHIVGVGSILANSETKGILWYDQLPLLKVLEKVNLVISQGGTGSTYQALSKGIPTLCVPNHHNQLILAQIIENKGLGLCLDRKMKNAKIERVDFDYSALKDNAMLFASKNPPTGSIKSAFLIDQLISNHTHGA